MVEEGEILASKEQATGEGELIASGNNFSYVLKIGDTDIVASFK